VTVAVKGIGDEIQRVHARQLVKGTGRDTTKQKQNMRRTVFYLTVKVLDCARINIGL
jgi:hypothetical protein